MQAISFRALAARIAATVLGAALCAGRPRNPLSRGRRRRNHLAQRRSRPANIAGPWTTATASRHMCCGSMRSPAQRRCRADRQPAAGRCGAGRARFREPARRQAGAGPDRQRRRDAGAARRRQARAVSARKGAGARRFGGLRDDARGAGSGHAGRRGTTLPDQCGHGSSRAGTDVREQRDAPQTLSRRGLRGRWHAKGKYAWHGAARFFRMHSRRKIVSEFTPTASVASQA